MLPSASPSASLLPVGLYDQLPPHAEAEMRALGDLMQAFVGFGYAQVSPPLLEFEDTLLSGRGAHLSPLTFRIMDPGSHRMLGLRADMTMQIARIASARLSDLPRPLRLCYAGQTVRVQGESLRPRRQHRQAGIELISDGTLNDSADGEVACVALTALKRLGFAHISIDLNAPGMVRGLLLGAGVKEADCAALEQAIAHKDATVLDQAGLPASIAASLKALMQSAGSAAHALPLLKTMVLPEAAAKQRNQLCAVASLLAGFWPDLPISIDAVENRGFEYHHGISFSLFAAGSQTEIGRGGRYMLEGTTTVEATGVTIYMDALQPLLPPLPERVRVLVCGAPEEEALEALQTQGYQTILGGAEITTEAEALKRAKDEHCQSYWFEGGLTPANVF